MSDITPQGWQDDVMTAFAAYWATVFPDVEIGSPNRPFNRSKVDGTRFIEWVIQGTTDAQTRYSWSTERNHFSREGTITFTANLRVKRQSAEALELLDSAGRFLETAVVPGGYFKNLGTPVSLGDDGAWYQVALSSGWLYFSDRSSAPV